MNLEAEYRQAHTKSLKKILLQQSVILVSRALFSDEQGGRQIHPYLRLTMSLSILLAALSMIT